ncbi:metal-sensing transcriptional repressor [Bacillus piscicola]|uniref:metal-sensitive transcriptional regulator n=1 Tax=Bacillus piscicola TaxID=1632684 RepID=UPI001F09BF3E
MENNTRPTRSRVQPNKENLLNRLRRIEGQVKGIHNMIDNDRYCVDVLNQIAAVQAAISKVSVALVEDHTHHCVANAIKNGEGEEAVDELMEVMKRLIK